LIRLTTAIRIGNAKGRSWAALLKVKARQKTLGIGTYCRRSLEMGKHVIREGKSKQIDRQYLRWKKWNVEASYTILSSTLT
jgi:hypothetical protein